MTSLARPVPVWCVRWYKTSTWRTRPIDSPSFVPMLRMRFAAEGSRHWTCAFLSFHSLPSALRPVMLFFFFFFLDFFFSIPLSDGGIIKGGHRVHSEPDLWLPFLLLTTISYSCSPLLICSLFYATFLFLSFSLLLLLYNGQGVFKNIAISSLPGGTYRRLALALRHSFPLQV